jgi:EAL domain-containing protein (putative c-di-GMP-specific phosphodiesterase class I)
MIKKIGGGKRDDSLLAGLAKLCGEMGITTIAEWIETEATAKAVRDMGFQQGQGKWLGAPLKEFPLEAIAVGKRKGATVSWG